MDLSRSHTAITNAITKMSEDPHWRGERKEGSGAERKTTPAQDAQIEKFLLDRRGKEKVTVSRLKKEFVYLRKVSNSLVEDRLADAELGWKNAGTKVKLPLLTYPSEYHIANL